MSQDRGPADVVVIGAGIVGAACAYFLAQDGARVVLIERGHVAAGTSSAGQSNVGAGVGTLSFPAYFRLAVATYAVLRDRGLELGYAETGGLVLAADEAEARALTAEVGRLQAAGTRVRSVDGAELAELEPALAGATAVALEIEAAQVNPMRATLSLVQAAMSSGTNVRHATSVTSLVGTPGGWEVGTTSGMIRAQRVVLASGVWSRELAALVGVDLPVWPRKGHILVTEPAPKLVRHILFEYGYESSLGQGFAEAGAAGLGPPPQNPEVGTVIQPLPSGQILVGNSREYAGLDRSVNRDRLRQIAQRAVRFIPGLQGLRAIHSYAGLRPWSPDGIPLIGELAERPGLFLATGHGGGGITGGPVTGRIIADLLGGRGYPSGLERLSPDRFGGALYRGAATPGEPPSAGAGA